MTEIDAIRIEWKKNVCSKSDTRPMPTMNITHPMKCWMKRNKQAFNGLICILASIIVALLPFINGVDISYENGFLFFIVAIALSVFMFVKGIFTLAFHLKTKCLDLCINDYLMAGFYNQLYFIYEKIVWFYGFCPFFIILSFFVDCPTNSNVRVAEIVIAVIYFICLPFIIKYLRKNTIRIKAEIEKIKAIER